MKEDKRRDERAHEALLPGADIVESGFRDIENGEETQNALLVATVAPRLRSQVPWLL
jgi:hypothetical protein